MIVMNLITFLAAIEAVAAAGVRAEGGSALGLEVGSSNKAGSEVADCEGELNIPFMVTNVELTEDNSEHYFGYHSDAEATEMRFLRNIRYCPDAGWLSAYRIYGTLLSPEEFKSAVEEEVNTNPAIDHVLYNIHGVQNEPLNAFMGGYNFNRDHGNTGLLVIPISWRNLWGAGLASYDIDRNDAAPRAGRQLAAKFDAFRSSVPTSLMAHSMGNYVTRVMAQHTENPETAFDNVFMVAADARMDMFGTAFNPAAPGAAGAGGRGGAAGVYLGVPEDELRQNGGLAITQIASHVHVVWNRGDMALAIREAFQVGGMRQGLGNRLRRALGKFGDQAEALTTLPYFQERVTYHDFSRTIENIGIEHGYQWDQPCVDLYVDYKQEREQHEHGYEDGNEDGRGCTLASDCKSGRCDFSGRSQVCQPRLELGERCNEDNDCISLNCGGWNPLNWQCIAPDQATKLQASID